MDLTGASVIPIHNLDLSRITLDKSRHVKNKPEEQVMSLLSNVAPNLTLVISGKSVIFRISFIFSRSMFLF